MLSRKVRRWSSRSRYGTMMATRCLDVHSVGWYLPPGDKYGNIASISSMVPGTSAVIVLTVPCRPGGIMGHCGSFGSAWNRGRLVSVPFESDVTVQFWFWSSWFSIHCWVGPRIDNDSSSDPLRPKFWPPPTPLRSSDKLSSMGLAPSWWSTSSVLPPLSRSPQSRVKSEIRLEVNEDEVWAVRLIKILFVLLKDALVYFTKLKLA